MSTQLSADAALVLATIQEHGAQHQTGLARLTGLSDDVRRKGAVAELQGAGLVAVARGSVLKQAARTAIYVFEPEHPPAPRGPAYRLVPPPRRR